MGNSLQNIDDIIKASDNNKLKTVQQHAVVTAEYISRIQGFM